MNENQGESLEGTSKTAFTTEQNFFGHPKGLFYLAFTEAWERFSFYGMTALLVLYMVNQLLLPGHVEHIAGFEGFRNLIESITGPLSTLAIASLIFGLYSGFVYFTPVFGGLIADRWTGQRNAVVIGALLMTAGHIVMAFDQTFLLALLLLIIGSGFLKGNIAAQVGALYPADDEVRRTRGFVIFSTAINIGAIFGPLLCGYLAQAYGWHYGFGIAGVFMVIGLLTYLYGYRYLPAKVAHSNLDKSSLSSEEKRKVIASLVVIIITIFQSASYYQLFNVFKIWIQENVDLSVGGFNIPVPWFQSVDSIASVLAVPLLFIIWKWQASRGGEPNELQKIGTGAWIAVASHFALLLGIFFAGDGQIHLIWPVLCAFGMGIGFMYQMPTLLAIVSRGAPARFNSTMMGIIYISVFVANLAVGWLGGIYESMSPAEFWLMHAAIAAVGGVLILLFGKKLNAILSAKITQA
ncbi:peptide MFS transporter [Algoriphagus sp. SE2]|uniref:peptide MFS transporter n=1 Tax=Algoriphagus sp. SE2 TaxID=3141536 RepID=UPI0031CDAE83